tara:strand:+ start:557 stop:727 length:171 start_codon:yes stop_codon:yes gene_type:complete
MSKEITLQRLKNVVKDIKENSYEGNDSHSTAEYRGICDGLDRLLKHFIELDEEGKN